MGKKLYHAVYIPSIIAGLFMGIFIKTGQDISPEGILTDVLNVLSNSINNSAQSFLNSLRLILFITSLMITVINLIMILLAGLPSVISSICGYVGIILIVVGTSPVLGFLILLFGEIICLFAPDS